MSHTQLQNDISRADSLLWLGSLSAQRLDSVLAEIRQKKRQELLAEQESESASKLVNRNLDAGNDKATSSSIYGFLNHRNQGLVEQGKREFKLIWGDRPRTDNWRRIAVVRQYSSEDNEPSTSETGAGNISANTPPNGQLDLDLNAIPRTSDAKTKLKVEKVNAQYELGNLFFLNLNLPDSAPVYFQKVVASEVNSDLRARAMYSLQELYKAEQKPDSLQYWRNRILDEYPQTRYAQMSRSGKNEGSSDFVADSSSDKIRKEYHRIDSLQDVQKPLKLRRLALANRSAEMAPYIHYRAIETYIDQAQYSDLLRSGIPNSRVQDTSVVAPQIVVDSVTANRIDNGSFNSALWDSVRMVLQEFDTTFTDAKQRPKVKKLQTFLEQQKKSSSIKTCSQLGISLSIDPGMDGFLASVDYPDNLKNSSLSGELEYSFVVTSNGKLESYQLESNRTSLGIEEAFEKAFDEHLQFKPVEGTNIPQKIRCTVHFPIKSE